MSHQILGAHEKALRVNLDRETYGAFAEIGAGQEVARWFFRVGGAAGTISKTISAYDMTVSDAIYGSCERYVGRQRLQTMLTYEFELQQKRLAGERGGKTRFFAFANTVAARSYSRNDDWHGWMGIRFQAEPMSEPSEIIIHVRMHDRETVQQQEALGIMGVNLVFAALCLREKPEILIESLMDNLNRERVEVDTIKFSGPSFADVDNRLMALQLVKQGLTDAAMFTAAGEVVQAAEVLHRKPILVERGTFRPVTNPIVDMLDCAYAEFINDPDVRSDRAIVLMEMTLNKLAESGVIDHGDFLDRIDTLGALGKTVLISNYGEFHRLATYLFRYTKERIGIVMGAITLHEVFEEKYYEDLEGGILESFGRLFKNDLRVYVYPFQESKRRKLMTAEKLEIAEHLKPLHAYLLQNGYLQDLGNIHKEYLPIRSFTVLERIRKNDSSWKKMVPRQVAEMIEQRRLFGYPG